MKKLSKRKKIIITATVMILLIAAVIIIYIVFFSTEYKRTTISAVFKETENYQFGKHDNLEFDCTPLMPDTQDLYSITADFQSLKVEGDEGVDALLEMAKNFLGLSEFSDDVIIHRNETNTAVYDFAQGFTAAYYASGAWSLSIDTDISHKIYGENNYDEYERTIRSYNVLVDGIPEDSFETYDGRTADIGKTIENAEKLLNEKILKYLGGQMGEELVVDNVGIVETNEGNQCCVVNFNFKYNDLILNSYGYITDTTSIRCPALSLVFADENTCFDISNYCYDGNRITSKEKVKGLVYPLSSAEQIVSDMLAPNKKYVVSEVSLRNVCINESSTLENVYKPMWVFVLEDKGTMLLHDRLATVAFVDLKSGEFYAYDMSKKASFEELEEGGISVSWE